MIGSLMIQIPHDQVRPSGTSNSKELSDGPAREREWKPNSVAL